MRSRLVVIAATIAFAGVADAQPSTTDVHAAAALYDKGKRHFDIAEYSAAIAAWKEAYLLASEPLLLFNIAQAHRLAGDCAQANRFYLNYKRVQPRPPNQAELDSAMAKCAGIEPATGDSPTTPTTPTAPPVISPPPPPVDPPPVEPPPPTAPAPRDTVETDQGRTLRLSGIAVAAAGGVAGGIAVIYASRASSKADEISEQPAGSTWSTRLDQIERDGKSAASRARIFGVLGGVAAVTGAVLYFYGRSKSAVRVDIAVTPSNSQVSVSCAF